MKKVGMGMIKNLSIAKRIGVSNLLYALPIMVLMTLMYQAKTKDIDFGRWEMFGDIYQKPLMGLLEEISDHKILAQRALHGDAASRAGLADVQVKISQSFDRLMKVQAEYGDELQFTDEGLGKRNRLPLRPDRVRGRWQELVDRFGKLTPDESNTLHTKLIADVRGMITHSGDISNLILDPDLDSYYMMDVTLLALPQTQDRVQEIVTYTEPVLRRRHVTQEEKIQLSVYAALLQSDLDRIVGSIQTSINEDANFFGKSESLQKNMPGQLAAVKAKVDAFIASLQRAVQMKNGESQADGFVKLGKDALSQLFKFSAETDNEMNALLQNRIDIIRGGRTSSVLWGLFALIVATTLSSLLAYSVKSSLTSGLSKAMVQLRGAVDSTRIQSTDLVDTSARLSSASTEQASAIQETVATLNEISAMVNKSLENSIKSTEVAHRSHEAALTGKTAVVEMNQAILGINVSNESIMRQIEESNRQIEAILHVIAEIGNKTKVINDIVFQTKLLSFNASVEAARAGEHGKGFAVVAEEVGNLARMSGTASKEISEMLSSSMGKVQGIVDDTRTRVQKLVTDAKSKVEIGSQVALRCSNVLDEIVVTAGDVSQMVSEISRAAEEQAKGVNEITKAMNQLDQTIHENSQMATQTANYSESFSSQAEILDQVVLGIERDFIGKTTQVIDEVVAPEAAPMPRRVVSIQSMTKKVGAPAPDDRRFVETPHKKGA